MPWTNGKLRHPCSNRPAPHGRCSYGSPLLHSFRGRVCFGKQKGGNSVGVFKKQSVYWIDYYVNGRRKRERIGPDKRLAETVLRKRKVEIAEGRFLEKQRPITTTFDELAEAYLSYARDQQQKRSWTRDRTSIVSVGAISEANASL